MIIVEIDVRGGLMVSSVRHCSRCGHPDKKQGLACEACEGTVSERMRSFAAVSLVALAFLAVLSLMSK